MKKAFRSIVLLLTLACALTLGASAAVFESNADALNELGLFQGGTTGYELDREPTRAEAAVMLTRMLGQEDYALAAYENGEISHPFTDTDSWMDAYIAYLYENGYTTGSTATTFDPQSLCSDQMYVTFLLRSLGYFETAGDFTYADATTFGTEIGLVNLVNLTGDTFLRDNVVALTFTALTVTPKDCEDTLYEILKADGVVPEGTAAGALLDSYQAFCNSTDTDLDLTSMEGSGTMTGFVSMLGTDLIDVYADMELALTVDGETVQDMALSLTGNLSIEYLMAGLEDSNMNESLALYIKDGWSYVDMMGEQTKSAIEETEDASDSLSPLTLNLPIAWMDSCSVDGDLYTIVINEAYITSQIGQAGSSLQDWTDVTISCKVEDGQLTYLGFSMVVTTEISGIDVAIPITAEFTIDSFNEPITISFPSDLDSYVDSATLS